jgi:hypothetical protein
VFIYCVYTRRVEKEFEMKKVWKWVIGIVIGLVVIGLVAAVVFVAVPRIGMVRGVRFQVQENGKQPLLPNNGRVPFGYRNGEQPGWQGRMPGMMPFGGLGNGRQAFPMRHGMMGFGGMMPLAGLFGGLFFIGLFLLLVLSIIWMFRVLRKPAAQPVVAVVPCKKCGEPVQDGWAYCPHCGKKV